MNRLQILCVILSTALTGCFTSCNGDSNIAFSDFVTSYKKDTTVASSDFTTVEWTASNQDLGKVKLGDEVDMEFEFKNTGERPLVIDSAFVGCGCTIFSVPVQPVKPGKRSRIKARYITKDQPVAHNVKEIYLRANTVISPYHTLTFRVEVTDK